LIIFFTFSFSSVSSSRHKNTGSQFDENAQHIVIKFTEIANKISEVSKALESQTDSLGGTSATIKEKLDPVLTAIEKRRQNSSSKASKAKQEGTSVSGNSSNSSSSSGGAATCRDADAAKRGMKNSPKTTKEAAVRKVFDTLDRA
jgi:hypothetical protein